MSKSRAGERIREREAVRSGTRSDEENSVQDATRLSARLIYEVVRRDGEQELLRPLNSLVWSGVAAGILISFSVVGEAMLRAYLPTGPSFFLIENAGYSLGFLIVILGRMQLFTENTITTVLPVMSHRSLASLMSMLRLWSVVLAANVAGTLAAGYFMTVDGAFDAQLQAAFLELSDHATGMGAWRSFLRAIPAGVLVASIVWMMSSTKAQGFIIILTFTWLIAAGDFTHIIAGSVEMAYLLWLGELGVSAALLDFFLPVLFGNIIGGTVIFTMLAWGQVKNEVDVGTGEDGRG